MMETMDIVFGDNTGDTSLTYVTIWTIKMLPRIMLGMMMMMMMMMLLLLTVMLTIDDETRNGEFWRMIDEWSLINDD